MFALIIPLGGDGIQLPDHSLPERPGSGRPKPPSWGGGWGGGDRPGHDLPEGPSAKPALHQAVPESSIPSHPAKPDPSKPGEWLLVALGDGTVGWAWAETAAPVPEPK